MPGQSINGRIVHHNHQDVSDFLGRDGLHAKLLIEFMYFSATLGDLNELGK